MKKRISKKSMLSFLTVSAIVVTMAGSYAAWDKLSDSKTATLKLDKATVVTLDNLAYSNTGRADFNGENPPEYTSDPVKVSASDVPAGVATKLKLSATLKDDANSSIPESDFTVKIVDSDTESDATEVDFADAAAAETGGSYKVKITPNDNKYAGKTISVTLNAELKKATTTP